MFESDWEFVEEHLEIQFFFFMNLLIVTTFVSVGSMKYMSCAWQLYSVLLQWSYNRGLSFYYLILNQWDYSSCECSCSSSFSNRLWLNWTCETQADMNLRGARHVFKKKICWKCIDYCIDYYLDRWSSTAPSHPTWRSPRHLRSLASGPTAGPTPCSDWASLQSSSFPRWEETFVLQHIKWQKL